MSIRSAAKTIVINNQKILLIKYVSERGFIYYELPGGGQNPYEELEEAAKREFLEETGYRIKINRLAAVAEEIFTDGELRREYPEYAHRIHHIFQGEILQEERQGITELDKSQTGCEWVPLDKLSGIYLIPKQLKRHLNKIVNSTAPVYLGTAYEDADLK